MQSGSKNPPWARSNNNSNMAGINPQIMDPNSINLGQQNMMSFQQSFNHNMMQAQGGLPLPIGGQMQMNQMSQGQMFPNNVVAYPTPRALNPNVYQNSHVNQNQNNGEQRVFTGTVMKTHDDFGFVDQDVFYQTSVCAKGIIPKVNDRVLVEATYNANMPFKWNATRVQVLPKTGPMPSNKPPMKNSYNAVPPPMHKKPIPSRRDDRPSRRDDRMERKRSRTRSRSRSRDRRDTRSRRDSPPRKRPLPSTPAPPVKHFVRVPRIPLEIQQLDVPTISQRYMNMYVPSDFFNARIRWHESFPPIKPFSLNNPCLFHMKHKDVDNPIPNDAVLEPPDADYRFSAKVMLLNMPSLEVLYQKCGLTKGEEKEESKTAMHPTRLIKFLVGNKASGSDKFAIGGPWSPSLDGENPESDPQVLINTAIRTCKALTGIDLSACTEWYRMVEFAYWRGGGRREVVVLLLPDVWTAQAPRLDWPRVQSLYRAAAEGAKAALRDDPDSSIESANATQSANDTTITIDENDDDGPKIEPTHYTKINLKTIKVEELRQELRARDASCKGLRPQLISRISKLLKMEESKEKNPDDTMEIIDDDDDVKEEPLTEIVEKDDQKDSKDTTENKDDKKDEVKRKKDEREILEKERVIKSRYELPNTPHIIVHPSRTAKGGKFNCHLASLSFMLDYRVSDNKEHSFELFIFAEIFNEMLMRDFGFYIYKTLYKLPEKVEEDEKTKDKSEVKEDDKRDEKRDDRDKNEKKDDKRDSRKRDIKDSEDSRSDSPSKSRNRCRVDLPVDPYLLLSLIYFDTARSGYVQKKDLQTLFLGLGLNLSRSQITNLLEKVCLKDSFNYRHLIQSVKELPPPSETIPDDDDPVVSEPEPLSEIDTAIATGNRGLLPVFDMDKKNPTRASETLEVPEGGMVSYNGRVVSIGSLVTAAAAATGQRARLEAALVEARTAARSQRSAAAAVLSAQRAASQQLQHSAAALAHATDRIATLTASAKIFHSTLKTIQSKVDAVINIKYEDDDVIEIVNGPVITKVEGNANTETARVESKENKLDEKTKNEDKKTEKDSDKNGKTNKLDEKFEGKGLTEDERKTDTEKIEVIEPENMDIDEK